MIIAPGEGHAGSERAAAFVMIEPANGRSAEQVLEAQKKQLGSGFNITSTALNISGEPALVVSGLPGEDPNRQVFLVHNDVLYTLSFVPDTAQVGDAYWQMEDIYAMLVNTFHFTK
jgi:hypothetical protein